MKKFLENNYKAVVFAILLFVLVTSLANAWWDGAIFDETAHIPAGYSYMRFHDMRLNPEHPPMIKDLAGLPLVFMNLKFDVTKDFWISGINGQWDAGKDLLWQEGNDADQIIFWSRVPIIIISIILGLFIFKWTKELSGTIAGLFALVLFAFDPNILGHNHFVTTDLGIAAFMTFSFYYYLRFIKQPTWKNVLWAGLFLGLVQLAKFSSVMLFPVYGLLTIIYPFIRLNRTPGKTDWKFRFKGLGEYIIKGAATFAISLVLVWGLYLFNTYDMPQEKLAETINYYFSPTDVSRNAVLTNKALTALNQNSITRPISEYALGIAMVFKRVEGGNGAYFMGQVSGKGFPAYFPTVFLLKEPLVILFLIILSLTVVISRTIRTALLSWSTSFRDKCFSFVGYVRNNIVSLSLLTFIIIYSYISITGNLNIGFRHLFPVLPFIYILVAKSIFSFFRRVSDHQTTLVWEAIISFLCFFLITGTVMAYPSYMSYFNQLAGGPKNGYYFVTDSNADWGQDIKRLRQFVDRYNWCSGNSFDSFCKIYDESRGPIKNIRVDYFGGADIGYYMGDKYVKWWDSKRPVESGWYAISTNFLMGSLYDKEKKDNDSYRWIRDFGVTPIYQVGTSIFIYYIDENMADKINGHL